MDCAFALAVTYIALLKAYKSWKPLVDPVLTKFKHFCEHCALKVLPCFSVQVQQLWTTCSVDFIQLKEEVRNIIDFCFPHQSSSRMHLEMWCFCVGALVIIWITHWVYRWRNHCFELFSLLNAATLLGTKSSREYMAMKELSNAFFFVCSLEFWRMSVFWTYSLISSYWQLFRESEILKSYPRCSPSTSPFRPVCVITGATSGLGAATALALSKEGYFLVIVGRSHQLLLETTKKIKDCNGDAQVKAFKVDMSSLESIVTFRKSLQHWLLESDLHCSVQILINNAGILATSHKVTAEGYDQMIGTNYIGAFALTKLLLPLLESSPVTSRIVNVTSFTHRNVNDIQVDEKTVSGRRFLSSKQYPCAQIYEYSKLCLLLFSYELHRQLSSVGKSWLVSVTAVDPGSVQTNIMREVPSIISSLAFKVLGLLGLLQTPERGISSIIDAALAPPEASGAYFFGGKGRIISSSELSRNPKLGRQLWETTCNMLSHTLFGSEETKMLASALSCTK